MQVLGVEGYADGSGGQSGPNGGRSGSLLMLTSLGRGPGFPRGERALDLHGVRGKQGVSPTTPRSPLRKRTA